jgi:hypothetical protein
LKTFSEHFEGYVIRDNMGEFKKQNQEVLSTLKEITVR